MVSFELADFSGGLNIRDSWNAMAPNESPDMMNVTLDERGGLQKRLGSRRDDSTTILADQPPNNLFYWPTTGQLIMQLGARVFKRTAADTYAEVERPAGADAFTTDARATFADFNGSLYALHPADGVLKYTGSGTWSLVTSAVKGVALAVWKNRLWAGGPSSAGANPTRVWFSNIGNGDAWTTASDFVDLRDVSDEPITALGLGQGLDQGAVPVSGLLACKRNSVHRIQDAVTGAYTTLSTEAGAAGPLALTSLRGLICMVNDKGVWVTDGEGAPVIVSDKIEPVFEPTALNLAAMSNWCMGTHHDRIFLSLSEVGSSINTFAFEYSPAQGWFAPHDNPMAAYALNRDDDDHAYALSPEFSGTGSRLLKLCTGGKDRVGATGVGGTDIACRWQSTWSIPASHKLCRFRRTRVHGRGVFDLLIKLDFNLGSDHIHTLDLEPSAAAIWDDGYLWDSGALWGPSNYQNHADVYSHGVGMAISFELRETSGLSHLGRSPMSMLPAGEQGAVTLYSLCTDFVPLGYA